MKVEEILKKLIAFPTNSWKYDNGIKNFIIDLLNSVDKEIIDVPNTKDRCFAVRIKSRKSLKKAIAFLCHLDTVVPSDTWKSNPYDALVSRTKVVGLGASDMKGSIASLLNAIINLKSIERDVILLFTSDEEATVRDIEKLKKKLGLKDYIVIATEPTEGNVIIGQKGVLELRVSTVGKSSHASEVDYLKNKRNNAIYKMIQIMQKIREQEVELSKTGSKEYGVSSVNLGKIYGGSAVNVVPDSCSLEVSYRLNPSVGIDVYFSQIVADFKKIDPDIKVDLLLRGDAFNSAKKSSVNMIKNIIKKRENKVNFGYGKSWSEVVALSKDNICMVIGPGDPLQAHKTDEFIDKAKLNQFCQVYSDIISNV